MNSKAQGSRRSEYLGCSLYELCMVSKLIVKLTRTRNYVKNAAGIKLSGVEIGHGDFNVGWVVGCKKQSCFGYYIIALWERVVGTLRNGIYSNLIQ